MVIGGFNQKRNDPKPPRFSNLIATCVLILIVVMIFTAILLFLWLDTFIWGAIVGELSRAVGYLSNTVAAGQLPKDAKRWLRIDPKTGSAPWEEWINQTDAGTVPREKSSIDLWREKEGVG